MQQESQPSNDQLPLKTNVLHKSILFSGSLPINCSPSIIQCSPFPDSSSLIAYGGETYIAVLVRQLRRPPDNESVVLNSWEIKSLVELHHDGRVDCIAWSPLSTHSSQETVLSLCAGSSDRNLRYYFTNLNNKESQFILLEGHSDYINACAFSPLSLGLFVASTSDDHTCRIWNIETQEEVSRLLLKSPGVAVSWHSKLPSQVLVAEKRGVLELFDLRSNAIILSLYTAEAPLQDADWNPLNPDFVGAAVGGNCWCLWSGVASQSGHPQYLRSPVTVGVRKFRYVNFRSRCDRFFSSSMAQSA
jgi:nuclear pore complex protein Nup37